MRSRRQRLADRRKACGYSQEDLAEALGVDRTTVHRWEKGENDPQPWMRPKIARLLDISSGELDSLLDSGAGEHLLPVAADAPLPTGPEGVDDEFHAWELLRRVEATDVGQETLYRLEGAFDELAIAYPATPPQELLVRVRRHLSYVAHLLDGRKSLSEHRRLLTVGGWLSLLGATLHVDLKQESAATARLQTAAALAREARRPEIEAWCFETEAWRMLTAGDYEKAAALSGVAQAAAPVGSSALIQATAQEGRALARLGQVKGTHVAIEKVRGMVSELEPPQCPEHHYQYDPAKFLAYATTTLAWLGDASAEEYARVAISQLSPDGDVARWPRRVASAHIDLALILLKNGRMDEACDAAQRALLSGRVVPSNHWRALEVVRAAEAFKVPEAPDLREAYQDLEAAGRADAG